MLSKKIQVKQFRHSIRIADKSLETFRKKKDHEALHKFRVEVKKMKAILLLQSGSFSGNALPEEFTIQKVFKQAGKIRNAKINIELLREHHIKDKKIIKKQEELAQNKGEKFRKHVKAHRKKLDNNAAFFLRRFTPMSMQKVRRMFDQELRQLAGLSQMRLGQTQLHKFRIRLKNLLYTYALLPETAAKKMKLDIFYLKKLEKTIGGWHDVISTIDLLKEEGYASKEIPGKLLAERSQLREKVTGLFNDFHKNV